MIDQFTGGAQQAVVRAAEEARRLDHQHIGTEHLLLGILHDGQGAAATALAGFGVSLDAVRRQVEETVGRGVERSGAHLRFTLPAQQAIEYALAEAERREHSSAGAEHLLLGLLREREDTAVQVLVALGADADLAYRRVIESLPRGEGGW
jgi:ATP-dependent Clp protease ATP-binding subunit ClpC